MIIGGGYDGHDPHPERPLSHSERERLMGIIEMRRLWRSLYDLLVTEPAAMSAGSHVDEPSAESIAEPRNGAGSAERPSSLAITDRLRPDLTLTRAHRQLTHYQRDGSVSHRTALNHSQVSVLAYLVDARGQTARVRDLAASVMVSESRVRKIIVQLRRLCRDDDCELISTRRGEGYALYPTA